MTVVALPWLVITQLMTVGALPWLVDQEAAAKAKELGRRQLTACKYDASTPERKSLSVRQPMQQATTCMPVTQ